MAQGDNTTEWVGGPVGFGDDVVTFACTYTYQPGIGGVIPGVQNIDQVPPSYQNQGFSTTASFLRVYGGDQAESGDQMCSSYNTETQWTYISGSESSGSGALYQRGCCIARWLPGDNGGTNAVGGDTNTGGGTDGGDTTTITCADLFYSVTPYQENLAGDLVIVDTFNGESPLTNYNFNGDFDLIYNGELDQPLIDVEPCCTEETIGFPVEWINTPSPDYPLGGIGIYTPEQQQFILGRCVVKNNTCNINIEGITENTNGLNNNTIPVDNALYYQIGYTGNWTPVLEPCCQDYILGGQGYTVAWDATLGKCFKILDPCPTPTTATLDTTNLIVLNATRQECCTAEATGISTVYWDYVTNQCRYTPVPPPENLCQYDSYQIGPYQTTTQNLTNENIQQLFGYLDGELVPVSKQCCKFDVTGYEVSWDSNLKICGFGSSNTIDIVLNEEPISLDGCGDIFVSAKIFFTQPSEKCITDDPIVVSLLPNNPNISVSQIDVFDSETDGFDTWVNLNASFSSTGGTFNLKLNISGGIVRCCDYDIRVDAIKVDCYKDQERLVFDTKKCVGFDLARVIDNKRSWVYNPGSEDIGSTQDNLIRDRGEEGLIQGYGNINRTFAPSDDADIPWRYTDYYVQSNILEPHSKAVIISKEMELTFNMCSECCITYSQCPEGYTLVTTTGGTKYCSNTTIYCPSGYTLSAGTCYSGITTASTLSETITATTGSYCTKTANLLQLEEYKKVFQSFWVRMIEQFVPATTIFVSGEKWCNNDTFICTEFGECDYDFEYVDSEISLITYDTDPTDNTTPNNPNGGFVDENNTGETPTNGESNSELSVPNEPIIIEGFNITPIDRDPTGGRGIILEKIINPTLPIINGGIKERYYNSIIKGGVKEIFQ